MILSQMNLVHNLKTTFWWPIVMLPSHLILILPGGHYWSSFPVSILYKFPFSLTELHAWNDLLCPEVCILWSSLASNRLHLPLTANLKFVNEVWSLFHLLSVHCGGIMPCPWAATGDICYYCGCDPLTRKVQYLHAAKQMSEFFCILNININFTIKLTDFIVQSFLLTVNSYWAVKCLFFYRTRRFITEMK